MASYRWVVRKKIRTMKAEEVAHLVPAGGVLRALPSMCDERIGLEDFWEKAESTTAVCKTCKKHLREKQSRVKGAAPTASGSRVKTSG